MTSPSAMASSGSSTNAPSSRGRPARNVALRTPSASRDGRGAPARYAGWMTALLTPLLAAAMSGTPGGAGGLGSELGPSSAPVRLRAERLAPAAAPREWDGVDLPVARARLRAGASLAVPADGRAAAWRRDGSGVRVGGDVAGTVRVVDVRTTPGGDLEIAAEADLRSPSLGWRLAGRTTFRAVDGALEPGAVLPPEIRRLVIIVTPAWTASAATVARFERGGAAEPWREVGPRAQGTVGRSGLGWLDGLHRAHPGGPELAIGDGRTPAGAFRHRSVAGVPGLAGAASFVAAQPGAPPGEFDVAVSPELLVALAAFAVPDERASAAWQRRLVDVAAAVILPRPVYDALAPLWALPPLGSRNDEPFIRDIRVGEGGHRDPAGPPSDGW